MARATVVIGVGLAMVLLGGCPKDRPTDSAPAAAQPAAAAPPTPVPQPPAESAEPAVAAKEASPPPAKPDESEPKKAADPASSDTQPRGANPGLPPGAVDLGDGRIAVPLRIDSVTPLQAAGRDIAAKWQGYNGLSASFTARYSQRKDGAMHLQNTKGSLACLKKGGTTLVRNKSNSGMTLERKKDDYVMTGERLDRVFDGEFLYTLQHIHAGQFAFKRIPRPGELEMIGGPSLLSRIQAGAEVVLGPEESLGGSPMYVFKASRKNGQVKAEYYVDRETGLLRKLHVRDEALLSDLDIEYADFEINPTFPEDYFTFVLPPGVEFMTLPDSPSLTDAPPPAP